MKSILSVVTAAVFTLYSSLLAAASVQLASIKGSVTGRAQGGAEGPLKQGDVVGSGWVVKTGRDSSAVLRFDDGQVVALQSGTSFRIDSYKYEQASPGAGQMLLSLLKGGMRAITGLVANTNRSAFSLQTSTATIGIRGTDFMTVLHQGIYSQVTSGSISATTSQGTGVFAAGQTMYAASAAAPPASIPAAAVPAGLFSELQAIPLAALGTTPGGAAAGAGPAAGGAVTSTAAAFTFLGVLGVAAVAAAAGGDEGSSTTTTTTHH